MAEQLARIFGTEEDRVNCPFYFKIGACRNGDQCNRLHNRPTMSQTLLLSHMYPNTPESLALANDEPWDDDMYDRAQQHLEAFYVEVFLELANYGEIEDLVVVDNLCDHMIGNVYVKYYHEEDAERALMKLTGRFYSGKLIQAEYTTVSDFREARCRAFHETRCNRGAYCNFMHIKHIPRAIKRRVVREMYDDHPEYLGQTKKEGKEKRKDKDKDKDKEKDKDRGRREHGEDGERKEGRSRSRRRDKEKKEKDRDDGPPARQTSEERRAMIASWNADRDGDGVVA